MTGDLASSLDTEAVSLPTDTDGGGLLRAFEVWLFEYERQERAEALETAGRQASASKTSSQTPVEHPGAKNAPVTVDLVAHLNSVAPDLVDYLDDHHGLALGTVERLYRHGVALLQGRVLPDQVASEWEDFFPLADAFVVAYGSERLIAQNNKAALLSTEPGRLRPPLTGADRSLLVDLVRELGDFIVAYQSYEPEPCAPLVLVDRLRRPL